MAQYEGTKEELDRQERINSGTSKTGNGFFDLNGYLVIKDIWNPKDLYCVPPKERGQMTWWGSKMDQFNYKPEEGQVSGSLARYSYPPYNTIHSQIRLKVEKEIGKKLYNTYYYDRFYFPGQELKKHADRDACEISVTFHISTNLKTPWPIWIKTPDIYTDIKKTGILKKGEERSVFLNPGDAMVYKGCERPHWRDAMPTEYTRTWYGRKKEKDGLYYHQVFFHYVLADGQRAHFAMDRVR
jgi:hypothetical protein